MVAQPQSLLRIPAARAHLTRLGLALLAAAAVSSVDLRWKAAALAAARGAAVDTPTTVLRPLGTILIGLLALGGVVLLPRLCLPGVLLVVGGASSNVASLALWRGVPNPLGVGVAGGVLHFNLADLCVWAGGGLFLAAALWTIARMPAERFT